MGSRDRPGREMRKPKKDAKKYLKPVFQQSSPVIVLKTKGKKEPEE